MELTVVVGGGVGRICADKPPLSSGYIYRLGAAKMGSLCLEMSENKRREVAEKAGFQGLYYDILFIYSRPTPIKEQILSTINTCLVPPSNQT